MHLFRDLRQREKTGNPILAGIIGCGFFGAGVLRQLVRTPGIRPAVIANRTPEKVVDALRNAGVAGTDIRVCQSPVEVQRAIARGIYAVTGDLDLPVQIPELEVIAETTGNILVGAHAACDAIAARKHFVAANPETQSTVGSLLRRRADEAGVIYSDMDGDQPGILKKLYDYVQGVGLRPVVAGNCKGVMKRYATPETQAAYCRQYGIKPWIATAAADGTKLNVEMCLVANATGLAPVTCGMVGVQTTLETLLHDFSVAGLLERDSGCVEYTLGIPVGVFVIGHSDDPWISVDMNYLKMGRGPHYLFFYPHVLCQFDAVPSLAEAVLYQHAVITPEGPPTCEVATFAKRELPAGTKLDGIGGFDCSGQIVTRRELTENDLLPVGMAEFARLRRDVSQQDPIRLSDIEWTEDNLLLALRSEQDRLFSGRQIPDSAAVSP